LVGEGLGKGPRERAAFLSQPVETPVIQFGVRFGLFISLYGICICFFSDKMLNNPERFLSQNYEREDTLSCIGVPLVVLARQIFAYSAQSSRGPAERKPVLVVRQIRANKTVRLLSNISSILL